MKKSLIIAGVFVGLFIAGYALAVFLPARPLTTLKRTRIALGTVVEIQVRSADEKRTEEAIRAAFDEVSRIEVLLSAQNPESPVWKANHNPAQSVALPPEIYRLMQRSGEWHRLSDGAFDAALGALVNLWGFGGGSPALPRQPEIMAALSHSGWERVQLLDGERVSRPAGVQLDFGGIGKGYAVDRAVEILRQHGVSQALVNAGGEIAVLGGGWRIGIQHPRLENALLGSLELKDMAVATSGDYQQFFELDGKRYHHILDPKTGYPATGAHGVTVIAPNCTDADALATALFVLGPESGLALVENLPGVEALIIDNSGKIYVSKGFNGYLSKQ